jgi:hypothetical protein
VVAASGRPAHQRFDGFARAQQTDTQSPTLTIWSTSMLEIGENGFERKNIAMVVDQDRQTHGGHHITVALERRLPIRRVIDRVCR